MTAPTSYSIHSLDGGRVLVAVGLTLTPALRDRLIDATESSIDIASDVLVDLYGSCQIPSIGITHRRASTPLPEADQIEIRSLLAAHAAEVIS